MKYYIPSRLSTRAHTIGKTEFIVMSSFCGYETIMQKLTRLMEDELDESPEIEKPPVPSEKTLDICGR